MEASSNTSAHAYQRLTTGAGYRDRPGQRAMVEVIERILAPDHVGARIACIEGQTGTGKSLGYLLGALPWAQENGKRLVIATATVSLQDQLLAGDIPIVSKLLDKPVDSAIAKGRRRYVCDQALIAAGRHDPAQTSLFALESEAGSGETEALWGTPATAEQRNQLEAMALGRARGTWDGSLDTPPVPLDPDVATKVTVGLHGCAGKACPHFVPCAYRNAKVAATQADVVVTNHALLLTDLALGGGVLLPSIEECVVVIDEAHHLPDAAVEQFTATLEVGWLDRVLRRAPQVIAMALRLLPADKASDVADVVTTLESLRDMMEWWMGVCVHRLELPAVGERTSLRAADPPVIKRIQRVWSDVRDRLAESATDWQTARKVLRRLRDGLRTGGANRDIDAGAATQVLGQLGPLVDVLDRASRVVSHWAAEEQDGRAAPVALWVEARLGVAGRAEMVLAAAPVDPAGLLQRMLLEKAHAVVLTSATLKTLGDFSAFASRIGLRARDGTQFVALESPFDLTQQARLVIPKEACDPRDEASHTRAVAAAIERLHDPAAGTLVLFTARRQLQAVIDLLPAEIRAYAFSGVQGSRDKALAKHRARVAKGQPSILLGLESFAEGLDLPGDQCRAVIVTRLPFRPPNGPIEETLEEWLRARGRSFFRQVALPETQRRLVQRLGRLIRTEQDTGSIYVLDRRLVSTTYGRQILKTLPPYPVSVERE